MHTWPHCRDCVIPFSILDLSVVFILMSAPQHLSTVGLYSSGSMPTSLLLALLTLANKASVLTSSEPDTQESPWTFSHCGMWMISLAQSFILCICHFYVFPNPTKVLRAVKLSHTLMVASSFFPSFQSPQFVCSRTSHQALPVEDGS